MKRHIFRSKETGRCNNLLGSDRSHHSSSIHQKLSVQEPVRRCPCSGQNGVNIMKISKGLFSLLQKGIEFLRHVAGGCWLNIKQCYKSGSMKETCTPKMSVWWDFPCKTQSGIKYFISDIILPPCPSPTLFCLTLYDKLFWGEGGTHANLYDTKTLEAPQRLIICRIIGAVICCLFVYIPPWWKRLILPWKVELMGTEQHGIWITG